MGIKETVFYEGGPHKGDLILNILWGFTLIGLPLTVGAIVRAIWLRYRITDRRISVTGGWRGQDRTDIIYAEVVKLVKVSRGLGFWGDIVVTLRDRSKLELRALPNFREIYDFMAEKAAAKNNVPVDSIKG